MGFQKSSVMLDRGLLMASDILSSKRRSATDRPELALNVLHVANVTMRPHVSSNNLPYLLTSNSALVGAINDLFGARTQVLADGRSLAPHRAFIGAIDDLQCAGFYMAVEVFPGDTCNGRGR